MFDQRRQRQFEQLLEIEDLRAQLIREGDDVEKIAVSIADRAASLEPDLDRQREPSADARQVLLSSSPTGLEAAARVPELLSAEVATGIEAAVSLRTERLPTAHTHVFEPSEHPLVTFDLKNLSDRFRRLRVQSHIEGYSAHAIETVALSPGGGETSINQLPTLFPHAINSVLDATRATVHIEIHDLDGDGGAPRIREHRTFRVWLLPRTTAILSEVDPSTGARRDMKPYLACWVTPNSQDVMAMLRQAADHTQQKRIVGYQVDEAGVDEQIGAIFAAIKAHGITYVNSILAIGAQGLSVQRVRLPRESLRQKSANCIDGAVLYASVIEAGSLHPGIALIPGHAFLAWKVSKDGSWDFLETTMTGSHSYEEARESGRLLARKKPPTILDVRQLRAQGYLPLE